LLAGSLVTAFAVAAVGQSARPGASPEIRTSATHRVPACVTPERLMQLLAQRNPRLDPRYRDIAQHYKSHGEALRIRWDYAFFQMLLETNYLMFQRGNGEPGDVRARQNNFAGIGATGGGEPGDSFKDVSTGVLAQMQHLVAYSGERVEKPVAPRTREVQDDIVAESRALRRPVRFSDLTNRWAADRNYARSMEVIADAFRETFCSGPDEPELAVDANAGKGRPASPAPPAQAAVGSPCEIWAASYGGPVALLIRSTRGATVSYTVLQVEEGYERLQADAFIRAHAPNGETIGRYGSRDEALARVGELCRGPA
jgi:hypothetical protein